MSRIEAWNFMKKLNDGTATIVIRQKLTDPETGNSGKTGGNSGKTQINTPAPPTAKAHANNQDMTSEQKEPEKLEAKR